MSDHPTISNHVDRLPRTPFGAPRLSDYGDDSLSRYSTEGDLTDAYDADQRRVTLVAALLA